MALAQNLEDFYATDDGSKLDFGSKYKESVKAMENALTVFVVSILFYFICDVLGEFFVVMKKKKLFYFSMKFFLCSIFREIKLKLRMDCMH